MVKDTTQMLEELKKCVSFTRFYHENADNLPNMTLADCLQELLAQKGLKKADVIRKSELSETYAYQIFSGIRIPDRKKLFCLAIGMDLDLDQTQKLLKCSGYAPLYAKNPYDCVIIYGICKDYSIVDVNELLYDYGMETLG